MAASSGSRLNERSRRRGISLLEVLIAMFVLVVGLLGVAALLPVGQYYVATADRYDRTAAVGQAAFAEIAARRMVRPELDSWLKPDDGAPQKFRQYVDDDPLHFGSLYRTADPVVDLRGFPFAIDPLFCAANLDNTLTAVPATPRVFRTFPATPDPNAPVAYPNAPMLTRVTLQQQSLVASNVNPMGRFIAERIFMSQDDLAVDFPTDRDLPSQQRLAGGGARREFRGNYSWMFTVVPNPGSNPNLYTVSVVVFYKRQLLWDKTDPEPPERMVQIDSNLDAGPAVDNRVVYGIGTVAVNLVVLVENRGYLTNVRAGQWVLLAGKYPPNFRLPDVYRWYRIVTVDDETAIHPTDGKYVYRGATLAGPDWHPSFETWVSLFEGTVAVYEKTLRIEGDSMYTVP